MKIETSKAADTVLDYLVAKCQGLDASQIKANGPVHLFRTIGCDPTPYQPSSNWLQGGPIIEQEGISIERFKSTTKWSAFKFDSGDCEVAAETPLIAAMRCYVASTLGEEIEVPDELCGVTG